jgi:TPP-dependent pyruvate/acetoin dehydrogenase alpha subunit
MREAVARARAGDGPTLIEAMTYRMGAHSTADDPSIYRSEEESEEWQRVDPFERLKRHAAWRGVFGQELEQELRSSWEARIADAIAECERHPPPPLESLFTDVQHRMGQQLAEQREEYLRFRRELDREQLPEIP